MVSNKMVNHKDQNKLSKPLYQISIFLLSSISLMLTPIHAATIIDTIVVGNTPVGIDINSQTNKVYVANQNDGTIDPLAKG